MYVHTLAKSKLVNNISPEVKSLKNVLNKSHESMLSYYDQRFYHKSSSKMSNHREVIISLQARAQKKVKILQESG